MRDVVVDRLVEDQALALALLGGEADARADRGADRSRAAAAHPATATVPRSRLRAPKTVSRISRAAGADQPGQADDLARPDVEARRR